MLEAMGGQSGFYTVKPAYDELESAAKYGRYIISSL